MTPAVMLEIGQGRFEGWKTAEITLGVDQIAGTFALDLVQGLSSTRAPIIEGDACTVKVAGTTLITGYIDDVDIDHDSREVRTRVEGRDVTCDLVDCSAKPQQWRGRTITQIAADLTAPFGITVRAEADVGAPFATFAAEPGETVREALERMARHRGLLLVSDAQGGLVLKRPSSERVATALVLGQNLLKARARRSQRDRFSRYTVLSQSPYGDDIEASSAAQASAAALDEGVRRYRPLIVLGEEDASPVALQARATWERNIHAGRSIEINAVVQGWQQGAQLWQIDRLVRMEDPLLGLADDYYIAGLRFALDDASGSTTELRLLPPTAYSLLATPETRQ